MSGMGSCCSRQKNGYIGWWGLRLYLLRSEPSDWEEGEKSSEACVKQGKWGEGGKCSCTLVTPSCPRPTVVEHASPIHAQLHLPQWP